MATIKIKNSQVKDKAPQPSDLVAGELAINTHADSPAVYLKDTAGAVRKIAGVGAVGATDATTTSKGVVQLADAVAVTAGTAGRVVDAAQLKAAVAVENLWDRTGTVISPTNAGDSIATQDNSVKLDPGATGAPFVRTSTGLVGVGTSTPNDMLDVNGIIRSAIAGASALSAVQGGLRIHNDLYPNQYAAIYGSTNTSSADQIELSFFTSGTTGVPAERMRLTQNGLGIGPNGSGGFAVSLDAGTTGSPLVRDSQGRVGIGTAAPLASLHLGGTPAGQEIRISTNTNAGYVGVIGNLTQIAANRNPIDGSIVNTGCASAFINVEAEVSDGNIQFATTATNNSGPTERMRIKASGIVNITNTPTYADNTAAKAGGLVDGDVYRTATGQLMIVYT